MLLPLLHPAASAIDPFLVLILALGVDALFGEMGPLFAGRRHPVAWLGGLIEWADPRLNRPDRGRGARLVRGALMTGVMVGGAFGLGFLIDRLLAPAPWGWGVEVVLVSLLIAQRGLHDHVRAVLVGFAEEGLPGARGAIRHLVGRDPARLDEHGVCRAGLESLAENFSDGVVAPVFWYVVLGLPGIMAYKAINTLDSMIGHRNEAYEAFGKLAARLDDAANFLPARLAGLILATAALFTPGGRPLAALGTMARDAAKHRSVNAGWPEAALAGALDLALAGPRHYRDYSVQDPWIGSGRARATPADMRRGLHLFRIACLIHLGLVVALWLGLAALAG
ncbi:adenosylcobinamide-phosphate synthase CbiB [Roseospirillum parvum]|uniref:Cobalamin biosynthesis protein CobD n=1 Tax=Roseospirillum parvum TaxID=83401 RepID=A0A1G7WUM7_9PROT|nr:adenosylcobinamide-phosphate synthase CbiB [Roseospirillum parvum]SDG75642.1 adenosylcobinamide-phosphate synthase [Roseospirillum parvum]